MAVFLVNNCKFKNCGLTFTTLADLIQHIEDTHIDTDPRVLEKQELQQPPSIPLSYVLRFFTEGSTRRSPCPLTDVQKKKQRSLSPATSHRSLTPTGSEFDDEDVLSEDEDSDDSWTTQEEFTSEFIMSVMNHKDPNDSEKPFACPVPGCKKRYKNVNGIKYHARHGHKKDMRVKKAFKCRCGKSYKTVQGLRSHTLTHHPPNELLQMVPKSAINAQTTSPVQTSPVGTGSVPLTPPVTPVIQTTPLPPGTPQQVSPLHQVTVHSADGQRAQVVTGVLRNFNTIHTNVSTLSENTLVQQILPIQLQTTAPPTVQ